MNTQHLSAFGRSTVVLDSHPNNYVAPASTRFLQVGDEACPANPYANPVMYSDHEIHYSQCAPTSSTLGSAWAADELLLGGSLHNANGLNRRGIVKHQGDAKIQNYLP